MADHIPLTAAEHRQMHDGFAPCCPDAERVHCVCRISVKCPRHGTVCVGTHD